MTQDCHYLVKNIVHSYNVFVAELRAKCKDVYE